MTLAITLYGLIMLVLGCGLGYTWQGEDRAR
jgi:hypothetical protein